MTLTQAGADVSALRREVAQIPHWFHSIELAPGVVTPGDKTPEIHRAELATIPDVRGKSVLDLGAWDGYYTFAAEARGASRVVSLDHFVWSLDRGRATELAREWREQNLPFRGYEGTDAWQPVTLPGKRGYDLAHRTLGSRAECVVENFLEADLNETFDVVLCLGIVYHMKNPILALEKVRSFTKGVAVVESEAMEGDGSLIEFFERDELGGDFTDWWVPTERALAGMCRAAGFSRVEVVRGAPARRQADGSLSKRARRCAGFALREFGLRPPLPTQKPGRYRLTLHAWA
jgi:tRNA (mo5U34)-methyltransferase